jgi:hypothetical protein
VVKPVDKGQAICVLDREDYLKEGFKQLADDTKYKRVEGISLTSIPERSRFWWKKLTKMGIYMNLLKST